MAGSPLPTGAQELADLLARWRREFAGAEIFRTSAGADWLGIHFAGEPRRQILLTALSGANLVLAFPGRWPDPLRRALPAHRKHPRSDLFHRNLEGARMTRCGLLRSDRVAAFEFEVPGGKKLFLMHQLFGSRGNTVLLDERAELVWAWRRPPSAPLSLLPPEDTWTHGEPGAEDTLSDLALDRLIRSQADLAAERHLAGVRRRLKSARKLVENLSRDLVTASGEELYRDRAEALAAHLHEMATGTEVYETRNLRTGEPLIIPLDPALSPAENMERWFRKAKKARSGREIVSERLEMAKASLDELEQARIDLAKCSAAGSSHLDRLACLQEWQDRHPDLESRKKPSPGSRSAEEPARPFRRYRIDGKWEVWVGRNNHENDDLTHRASHVKDLWFHAQGVAGSHVVLRTGGHPDRVPPAVLATAAAIAALNSKARNSSLVPVIYTERRFVRKPRKAPPGTAVCLRESSLFVEPGIGSGVEAC